MWKRLNVMVLATLLVVSAAHGTDALGPCVMLGCKDYASCKLLSCTCDTQMCVCQNHCAWSNGCVADVTVVTDAFETPLYRNVDCSHQIRIS